MQFCHFTIHTLILQEIMGDPPVVTMDHKLPAQFHSGTLKIMDTMRLMSLFWIIAKTPIGIRLKVLKKPTVKDRRQFSQNCKINQVIICVQKVHS